MSKKVVEGKVKALSPIHSGGDEKTGNQTLLRRQKFYLEDIDEIKEIPFISGNSVRGHLRRLLMDDFVKQLGYTVRDERLFHSLYGGGILQKSSSSGGKINVDMRKKIRKYIVPLNLLGTAINSQMISGVLNVSHMLPICSELSERLKFESDRSVHEYLDFVFHTRSDESGNKNRENVNLDDDDGNNEDDESNETSAQQMKYEMEVFIAGTGFEHSFTLEPIANDKERQCLARAIELWSEEGTIGGMSSSGFGNISLEYDIEIDQSDEYLEFIKDNRENICEILDNLSRK